MTKGKVAFSARQASLRDSSILVARHVVTQNCAFEESIL